MALLEQRLESIAPENAAEFPLSCYKTKNEGGELVWFVEAHVRIPKVTEYEVTGEDKTLAEAARRAYLALNSEARLRGLSDAANKQFGVEV